MLLSLPLLRANQLGRDVVHFRRFSCLRTTHYLLYLYLKFLWTFVVRFWSGIVLEETGVRLKRIVVEVTAVFTPSV